MMEQLLIIAAIAATMYGLLNATAKSKNDTTQFINVLKSRIGTPYKWGGTTPAGFDCSGLVMWAYAQIGKTVPRLVTEQAQNAPRQIQLTGKSLPQGVALLRPGDQIGLDYQPGGRYSHVGTYIGKIDGKPMIIAASGGETTPGQVKYQELNQWWADNWRTAYSYL